MDRKVVSKDVLSPRKALWNSVRLCYASALVCGGLSCVCPIAGRVVLGTSLVLSLFARAALARARAYLFATVFFTESQPHGTD